MKIKMNIRWSDIKERERVENISSEIELNTQGCLLVSVLKNHLQMYCLNPSQQSLLKGTLE